jgi:tetratricopeptide (TPR) repeat protein
LTLQPRNATAKWVRARILRQQRDLAKAASEIDQALDLQPNNVSFLLESGGILSQLGRYDEAFAAYTAVCRRHELPEARYGRAVAASCLGAFDVALADFSRAIELDGSRAAYFGSRARLYRWMGDYQRAMADDDMAVALAPQAFDAYVSRGISRWLAGELAGAVQDFEKALTMDERKGTPALLWLWQIHRAQGNVNAASAALAQAANLMTDPWQARIVAMLGGAETEDQLLELAVDDQKRLDAYYYPGAKAAAEGRADDAARCFQKCVDLGFKQYAEYDLALGLLAAPPPAIRQ